MYHIHTQGFCHRDLKLENILLNDVDAKIVIMSEVSPLEGQDYKKLSETVGTPGY